MKNKTLLGIGLAAALGLAGCAGSGIQAGTGHAETEQMLTSEISREDETVEKEKLYRKISAKEAKEMMDRDSVLIVDVRTLSEYESGHVPDAVNLPNEEITDKEPELLRDKDAVILLYCRSGRRSKEAAMKLAELGYSQVYDFGGIIDWPYETVKE